MAPSSTLVFPSAVDSLQADRGVIRQELRNTYNRLHSIAADAEFVRDQVAPAYPDFPLVPNQRAGAWYVKPTEQTPHAYFKSTDGHTNEHNFNLRRANLVLLPVIKERKGIILVDSTRRGKRFPDALSKTIPLWCATLNRARQILVQPDPSNSTVSQQEWDRQGALYTSPQAVGPSEHAEIAKSIDRWAQDLVNSAYDLTELKTLDRPLRPFFVSPASSTMTTMMTEVCYPVVCASASKLAEEADGMERANGFTYVQGSGDDHEQWSRGLTPRVFWDRSDEILASSRDEIDDTIRRILDDDKDDETLKLTASASRLTLSSSPSFASTRIRSTRIRLAFAAACAAVERDDELSVVDGAEETFTITVAATRNLAPPPPSSSSSTNRLASSSTVSEQQGGGGGGGDNDHESSEIKSFRFVTKPGKAGYPTFFTPALERAIELVSNRLRRGASSSSCDVLIRVEPSESQSEANDLGVAVALILLVRLYDDTGALLPPEANRSTVSKDLVRSRLQWILEAFPRINPSRAVLNRVNEFLMNKRKTTT